MGKICGFKQEGTKAMGFRFDGKFYTAFMLRKIRRED